MASINKALLGVAAGAAVLAFVGGGADASFTSWASATVQAGTGTVGVELSFDHPRYVSEGGLAALADDAVAWPAAPQPAGTGGPAGGDVTRLTALTDMGSGFAAALPVDIGNDGTLRLQSYTLSVGDPDAGDSPADRALADQTQVAIYDTASTATALTGTAPLLSSGSLWALAHDGPVDLAGRFGPLPAGAHHQLVVVLHAPAGGFTDPARAGTVAPTFSLTGSDV